MPIQWIQPYILLNLHAAFQGHKRWSQARLIGIMLTFLRFRNDCRIRVNNRGLVYSLPNPEISNKMVDILGGGVKPGRPCISSKISSSTTYISVLLGKVSSFLTLQRVEPPNIKSRPIVMSVSHSLPFRPCILKSPL